MFHSTRRWQNRKPPGNRRNTRHTKASFKGIAHCVVQFSLSGRHIPLMKGIPMKERIREMLSWYASENPGVRTNLARMLNHGRLGGTGKMVILPVDQGFEHGPARRFAPNPAGYDPRYHFQLAIEAGCNAYAAPLGFLEAAVSDFAGEIPLILKANNSDSLYS